MLLTCGMKGLLMFLKVHCMRGIRRLHVPCMKILSPFVDCSNSGTLLAFMWFGEQLVLYILGPHYQADVLGPLPHITDNA